MTLRAGNGLAGLTRPNLGGQFFLWRGTSLKDPVTFPSRTLAPSRLLGEPSESKASEPNEPGEPDEFKPNQVGNNDDLDSLLGGTRH